MTLTLPPAVKANEQGLPERCGQGRCLCVFSLCVSVCVWARAVSLPPSAAVAATAWKQELPWQPYCSSLDAEMIARY